MVNKILQENIFQTSNEIQYPPDLTTKSYLIFYPTDGFYISKKQHKLFTNAFTKLNMLDEVMNIDIEFLSESDKIPSEDIRQLSNFDYSTYESFTLLFENCIIDKKLRWSICVYQDYWGIIYGPNRLIREISKNYDFKSDLTQFTKELLSDVNNQKIRECYIKLANASFVNI